MNTIQIETNDPNIQNRIKELARPHFLRMCPCVGTEEERRVQENILLERMEKCSGIPMPKIICTAYEKGTIEQELLCVENRTFPCHGLFFGKKDVKLEKVFLYGMCIPESDGSLELDFLEEFYRDCYMTALLDSAREWMREYLSANWNISISAPFGPGFFGMGMEYIPTILELIDGNSIGLKEYHGALNPAKSSIGFFLAVPSGESYAAGDCNHCLGRGQNCMFCMNHTIGNKAMPRT